MLIEIAKNKVNNLKIIHENILKMQHRFAKYINKKRKEASSLKKRNKIYLFAKNLKRKKKSKKLNLIKIDSFFY